DRRRHADRDHVRKHGHRLSTRGSGPRDRGEHKKGPGPSVSGYRERYFTGVATQRQKTGGEPAGRVIGFYPQGDSKETRIGPRKRRRDHSNRLLAGPNGRAGQWRRGRDCAYLRGDDGRQENGL